MKKTLSHDPNNKTTSFLKFDGDDKMLVENVQEVSSILDANKRAANDFQKGSLIGNTQRHRRKVAGIPELLYYQLVAKFGHPKDNPTEWKRWLNDYDNRFFRTGGGTV